MHKKISLLFLLVLFISFTSHAGQMGDKGLPDTKGMIFIKGGCYNMGDIFGEGEDEELPVHEVCVDDFYLGEHEVTQGEWKEIMGDKPYGFIDCGDGCPVENVSWDDANKFIYKLNKKTGKKYRLPTEAEWEFAARDRGKKMRWAGTNNISELGDYAWYGGNSGGITHPVKTKKPNELGLYDMVGNVMEWMSDNWGEKYYKKSPRKNPKGPSRGHGRSARGGSCWSVPELARIANRHAEDQSYRAYNQGFRLALGKGD